MATVQLRTRIDRDLEKKAAVVLKRLGLDAGTFVSMSLAQLVNRRGLPFAVTESDEDYFAQEYDLTRAEAVAAGETMRKETARARKTGKLRTVNGLDDLA
jgi:addiction module RelB/DinJ family antitoxin